MRNAGENPDMAAVGVPMPLRPTRTGRERRPWQGRRGGGDARCVNGAERYALTLAEPCE